jgi:hypothetical protein
LDGPGEELLQRDAIAAHEQLSLGTIRLRKGGQTRLHIARAPALDL